MNPINTVFGEHALVLGSLLTPAALAEIRFVHCEEKPKEPKEETVTLKIQLHCDCIVRTWKNTDCTAGLDWSSIRRFSSSGEASNVDDYLWLMGRAGCDAVEDPRFERRYCHTESVFDEMPPKSGGFYL
ncbi:hypothetical protein ZEAMMB73_Zm00001d037304 [Zea mays]|uniref:Uncharacterized protein n=1 Tax=Zea mays TaxID=4577 RepID=A0A1D6LWA3_MAIZE|nr:hypothetical protein ZEAMMB73_Zm00001d037304 [Zea mays]